MKYVWNPAKWVRLPLKHSAEDLEEGVGGQGVGSDDVGEESAAWGIWWRRATLRISVGLLVPIPCHVSIAEDCSCPGRV